MKWKLVARMQVGRGATTRQYRGQLPTWIDIKLGPSRTLRCSCAARGEAIDLPHDVGLYGYKATGTCNHITALYLGHVTEDKRVAAIEARTPTRDLLRLVQLTKLGEQMFRWRWAQLALEQST